MSFKSAKQRGFLEEKFQKEGGGMPHSPNPMPSKSGMPMPRNANVNPARPPMLPNPNAAFAKDIKMPSLNAPNKFTRLKAIMKKSY